MNYIDAVDEKQSVVVFSGDCFKKDVKEYFSSNFYTRELNDKGLSILLKLMETEEFQKAIEERIANDKKISLDLAKHENLIQEELSL